MKHETNKNLIFLNGPPGIGKSTLSQRYVDEHPMTLNLDVDVVWRMMGSWQHERPRSSDQKIVLALSMTRAHLENNYSVVVAQDHIKEIDHRAFMQIAEEMGARVIEVTLICPVDEAVQRCIDRGRRTGYPTGFRPGGILESEGGEIKLRAMYDEMLAVVSVRPAMHFISSVYGDEDATYKQLLAVIDNQQGTLQ